MTLLPAFAAAADPPEELYKVLPPKKAGVRPRPRGENLSPTADAAAVKDAETHTSINIELIVGDEGVGLKAQEWQQAFQQLGCSVRIRSGLPTDKIETREQRVSRIRQVSVVGTLERSGRLVFQGRAFNVDEIAQLSEWIRELKTYGAQGSPEGKPLWGLSRQQFQDVFKEFSKVVTDSTAGLPLDKALRLLAPPEKFPIEQKVSARERLAERAATAPVSHEMKGFSRGTALAVVLAEYGLGFRPQRTPEGTLELAVESFDKTTDLWTIGWDLPAGTKPADVAPHFYQLVSVEFAERPLADALKSVSEQTGVPILLDDWRIADKEIKIDDIRVKHPLKQTSFDLVLRRITTPHRLLYKLRIDEAGRAFVWVTTLEPARVSR